MKFNVLVFALRCIFLSVVWSTPTLCLLTESEAGCYHWNRTSNGSQKDFPHFSARCSGTKSSKFSEHPELTTLCWQLYHLCKDLPENEAFVSQAIIDKARELVGADDEYKANAHSLTALLFRHPSLKKGTLIAASFLLGYGCGWLTFGQ